MKRISVFAVVTLCAVLYLCAYAQKGEVREPAEPDRKPVKQEEKKEKPYQKKLDMIRPSAYGNVMGLDLEEGAALSVIGKSEGDPYWEEVRRGAEQAAEDINENLGYEGKNRVKVTYSAPGTPDDVDEQVNILDEELARYPEALAIAIADANACGVQFDLAAESDIPIVAFDSGSGYQGLMAMVATDNRTASQEAAQRLAESMGETGEAILLIHDSKSESAQIREQAFREEIENQHPGITIAEVYYLDRLSDMQKMIAADKAAAAEGASGQAGAQAGDGAAAGQDGDKAEASAGQERTQAGAGAGQEGAQAGAGAGQEGVQAEAGAGLSQEGSQNGAGAGLSQESSQNGARVVTENPAGADGTAEPEPLTEEEVIDYLLEKHPAVTGFYATNGDAVKLAVSAVERNKMRSSIIGYDADVEELKALRDGKVDALVLQNPFGMGYAAVVASARAALSMGNEAVVDTGFAWLTRENMGDEAVQRLLYSYID